MSQTDTTATTIDDLDDDRTVYVTADYYVGKVHDDADCQGLDRSRATTAQQVGDLRDGYDLCHHPDCWGWRDQQPDRQYRDCPYCGERVGRLRAHLPCGGSPDA